eukprot:3687203-Rhodomonas_salina.1
MLASCIGGVRWRDDGDEQCVCIDDDDVTLFASVTWGVLSSVSFGSNASISDVPRDVDGAVCLH